MLKNLLRYLCLAFLIRNMSALNIFNNCCFYYEMIFTKNIRCTIRSSAEDFYVLFQNTTSRNEYSFNCLPAPELNEYEPIRQFVGSVWHEDNYDFLNCLPYYRHSRGVLSDCNVRFHSVTIKTDFYTEYPKIRDLLFQHPEILEINWQMHNKCHPVNEMIDSLKSLRKITLNAFDSVDLDQCKDFSFRNAAELTELYIYLNQPSSSKTINVTKYAFPATFDLNVLRNLKQFKLNCASNLFEVQLPIEMFRGLNNLKEISLESCGLSNLSPEHFRDLTDLRALNLSDVDFNTFHWLSSETLARSVTLFNITRARTSAKKTYFDAVEYFDKYTNLNTIFVDPPPCKIAVLSGTKFVPYSCKGSECTFFRNQTEVHCPPACHCVYENQKIRLELNCPTIEYEVMFRPEHRSAALHLSKKNLTKVPEAGIYNYSSAHELYLADNELDDLVISRLPENLTVLDIRNNSFKFLRAEVIEFVEQRKGSLLVYLSGNPWDCDCHPPDFMKLLERVPNMIGDLDRVECDGESPGSKMDACRLRVIFVILGLSLLFCVACVTVFWFRTPILMWLYYHNICANCIRRTAENMEFNQRFDGFLAFCHKNFDLVNEYVEQLENGPREFKLCFYQRDWAIGHSIPDCILRSIEDSRRIILLMTNQFIESSWGTFEFRTAIKATSMNTNKRLIIIVYPDVKTFDGLDSELKLYMKYNLYLRRDDPQFWKKLIYWMPYKKVTSSKKKKTKPNTNHEGGA